MIRPFLWCRKVNGMKVVLMYEYDLPKNEERNEKRLKHLYEVARPYWKNLIEEKDIKIEPSS